MNLETIKYFFSKHKKIKVVLNILAFLCAFVLVIKILRMFYPYSLELSSDFFCAIIGALIGGFLTLLGSICVFNKQQKAQKMIRQKGVIYKPLYDELMLMHNTVLKKMPFPNRIYFETVSSNHGCPQYTVWGRIKNDSRLFEVAPNIRKNMDALYIAINAYKERIKSAEKAADKICKEVVRAFPNLEQFEGLEIGSSLLPHILQDECPADSFWLRPGHDDCIPLEEKGHIWNIIMEQARNNEDINSLKDSYAKWNEAEEKALKSLEKRIKYINYEYEG